MTKLLSQNCTCELISTDAKFSCSQYKELVDYYKNIDSREINFQNRVIIPFLEALLSGKSISIVDVSRQYKSSKKHDSSKYSAQEKNAAPPDLLITRNWNIKNRDSKNIDYLAAVEIKSPILDPIYNKEFVKYPKHTQDEVAFHLKPNPKVILTDCIKWQFFDQKNGLDPVKTINFFDESKKEDANITQINKWASLCELLSSICCEK